MPLPRPFHDVRDGVCLSATSSAICKDGGVVSIQHAVQQGLGCGFVDIALCGGFVKHPVEGERLVLYPLPLWSSRRPCESVYGIVFWRVKDPRRMSARMLNMVAVASLQALLVKNLDDRFDALRTQPWRRRSSERAIA